MDNSSETLENRLYEVENPSNQGLSFSSSDYWILIVVGVILPAVLMIWGWVK